jgi:hypothetical protein
VRRDGDAIVLRAIFSLPHGPALIREWTWDQVRAGESAFVHLGPPHWLIEPEMSWPDPQGPVEVRANVPSGLEHAARELLGLDDAQPG